MNDVIYGENDLPNSKEPLKKKIATNAILCQCALPVSDLPESQFTYRVDHGNSYFKVAAGYLEDNSGVDHLQRVPYGSKARILLFYIVDQIRKNEGKRKDLYINMNKNLYSFMKENGIHISGPNREEIKKQLNYLLSCYMTFGIKEQGLEKTQKIEKKIFFAPDIYSLDTKDNSWVEEIKVSEYFAKLIRESKVNFDINFEPLTKLIRYPRSMDIYMWLTHKAYQLNKQKNILRTTKIPFAELHAIFGQQIKHLFSFKRNFKDAYERAKPFLNKIDADFESDKKNLILKSSVSQLYIVPETQKIITNEIKPKKEVTKKETLDPTKKILIEEFSFIDDAAELLSRKIQNYDQKDIDASFALMKDSLREGKVNNLSAFAAKALTEK